MLLKKNGSLVLALRASGEIRFSAYYEEESISAPTAPGELQIRSHASGQVVLATRSIALATSSITDVELRGRFSPNAVLRTTGALTIRTPAAQIIAALSPRGDLAVKGDDVTVLPDPSTAGDYGVTSITYAAPNLHYPPGLKAAYAMFETPTANYQTRTIDISDLVHAVSQPERGAPAYAWPFDITSVPINGLARIPNGAGPFPLIIFAHGNHRAAENSTPGYLYLCNRLATLGIIAATIDVNFLNGMSSGEVGARAIVHLEHIKQFQAWNEDDTHPLYGRVDLARIMIAGHSRGGEAVALAAYINALDDLVPDLPLRDILVPLDGTGPRPLGPYHLGIRGVIAIAPTDDRYRPVQLLLPYRKASTVVKDTNYLLMHGAMDADVVTFSGYRCYDRALPYDTDQMTEPASGHKSLLWIHQANHNYFNTTWGFDRDQNPTTLMAAATQRQIALVFIAAWAQLFLLSRSSYRLVFNTPSFVFTRNWLANVTLVSQYHDKDRLWLQTFDNAGPIRLTPPTTGTVTASTTTANQRFLQVLKDDAVDPTRTLYQETGGLRLIWRTSGQNYQIQNLAYNADISRFQVLALRVGQSVEAPNLQDTDQDFTIRVSDRAAHVYTARASSFVTLRYPAALSDPPTDLKTRYERKMVMQTIRIPLSALEADGVDVSAIHSIEFLFNVTSRGILYFDDIQLSL